jgi:predicted ATP-dependent Lon-type protease
MAKRTRDAVYKVVDKIGDYVSNTQKIYDDIIFSIKNKEDQKMIKNKTKILRSFMWKIISVHNLIEKKIIKVTQGYQQMEDILYRFKDDCILNGIPNDIKNINDFLSD